MHTFVILAYKESKYLEDCIKSVVNQKYPSKVIIATSTPNDYIYSLADKYKLGVVINNEHRNIGGDFDFALKCSETVLVTIAHQDDIYDYDYSYEIIEAYKNNNDAIILFPNYYEIKNDNKVYNNLNLKIKRILLRPLLNQTKSNDIKRKKKVLKYGCSIGCPSVTFNIDKIKYPFFECNLKCNVDWQAWEKIYKDDGKFVYINKYLMGHRISIETTTTEIINQGLRTKEDYYMFKKFWPKIIAKILTRIYKKSEKNNEVK